MAHTFPANFVRPTTKVGTKEITFEIDEEYTELIKDLFVAPKGKQFMIVAFEINKEDDPIQELHSDDNSMRNHLLKQIHATLGSYSVETGVPEATLKKVFKSALKTRVQGKESLKEFDEEELASAVQLLITALNPRVFNYSAYKDKK